MSRQQPDRNIPHLRDIFGSQCVKAREVPTDEGLHLHHKLDDLRLDGERASNDSAVSVGSASEDEVPAKSSGSGKKKRSSRRDNSRTLTEKDVKHLERHLSMKKTIRKKIMRDLRQAFVEDPDEFRVEDIPREQLKAEINVQSLSFGAPQKSGRKQAPESSFLDMLRGGGANHGASGRFDDEDSGHGSPTRESPAGYDDDDDEDYCEVDPTTASKKTSFWRLFTMKGRNKR